jgi:hypothetical protein
MERRNHWSRAYTMKRVLTWISREGTPVAAIPRYLVTPEAGNRMLKQLALRGLIRRTDNGWVPSSILVNPPELTRVDES